MEAKFALTPLGLPGVSLLTPKRYPDARGYVAEVYTVDAFRSLGITDAFVQDNISVSKKGVIRGLHFQRKPHAQAKLVRCATGEVFDVVADIDPASPTFGKSVTVSLSAETQGMLYIPAGYAHGFCVTSDEAIVEYKLSDVYDPAHAGGVMYNDPLLGISWPVSAPILSEQDMRWPLLPAASKGA